MGLENRIVYNLVDVVEGNCRHQQAIIRDKQCDTLSLLPAAQTRDKSAVSPEQMIKLINQLKPDYDYIIIDTQPTRDSLLLTNAINAADYVLIPSLCEANSQESAFRTYALCNELRNTPGSHLKGIGVILTMVVKKAASTKIIRDQCKQVLLSLIHI